MKFVKVLLLCGFLSLSPMLVLGGQYKGLSPDQLQLCKKIHGEGIRKALGYCDNPLNWSPLNYAIEMRDYKTACFIVDYTSHLNHRDSAYSSNPNSEHQINALERVLFIAQFQEQQKQLNADQVRLIEKLIERGIEFDRDSNMGAKYPILSLCYFNEINLVKNLLDRGVDINNHGGSLLSTALCCGHVELVHVLIERGVDVHSINMLHDAILGQKCELVQLAMDYGFDLSRLDAVNIAINYTWGEIRSLEKQCCAGLPALTMVHFLLVNGANPNFWIMDTINAHKNPYEMFSTSPLYKALHLLDAPPSFMQEWYQQFLINTLIDFGAALP